MKKWLYAIGLMVVAVAASYTQSPSPERALLNQYCVSCHNNQAKTGGLALDVLDVAQPGEHAEVWEKVVRKLRAGMMPPSGLPRPERAKLDALASKLEGDLDRAAAAHPNPGVTALHRLNRTEYANAIRDLLGLEVDAATLLPADDSAEGFDNVADVLRVSPSLMDRYVAAAAKISRLAVGDPSIEPNTITYRSNSVASELPLGTYGGFVVRHNFPLDGIYGFKVRGGGGVPYDNRVVKIEVTVNGEPVQTVETGYYVTADIKLVMKAGPQEIGFALVEEDPQGINHVWKVKPGAVSVTNVSIAGPLESTGPGDTPSRQRIFVCHPQGESQEVACAKQILTSLARRAYRGPVSDSELEVLLGFYQRGRNDRGFEGGIQLAIQRMRTGMGVRFEPATGGVRIEGAVVECDDQGRALSCEPLRVPVE